MKKDIHTNILTFLTLKTKNNENKTTQFNENATRSSRDVRGGTGVGV